MYFLHEQISSLVYERFVQKVVSVLIVPTIVIYYNDMCSSDGGDCGSSD